MKITELNSNNSLLLEYENKIALLSTEVDRLNLMVQKKQEEKKLTDIKLNEFEIKLRFLNQEIDRLNVIIDENNKELEQWRYKYVEYASLTKVLNENLLIFVLLFIEIESLRRRVTEKQEEVDSLRNSSLNYYKKI